MTELSPAEEIFFAALEKKPTERAAYLDAVCADQPELRVRVEKLLAAHPRVGDFLESGAGSDATNTFAVGESKSTRTYHEAAEVAGTVIAGRYKLLQQIGEGGMGTVWMADQTEPVKRRVAVKLIRVERGQSRTILSRFEAERQAIALMDHPHIAKLLDAGTSDAGSPYFVMELVKGVPLTDYCDAHKLDITERLNLFQQICSAVQHAHQKGIIHRDLKPTNILVESHDGKPVPKVIDFGLAKATTGLSLSEHTLFTAYGSVMGTPLYMAPEQATFNAVDVDTRADVYALGVILYELLTGTTPLTRETVKKAALDEMLKLIREQEAPTPSSRLSTAASAPSTAANRQSEPDKLGRFVRGELDWIVLKALSKERDRRYETASGFAKDIERFLAHEPVTAGPPGATYRLQKFVRRNRPQVVTAGLVLLALVAGVIGTTTGLIEAKRQEQLALSARKAESEQRQAAEKNEQMAVAATDLERQAKLQAETEKTNALKAALAEKAAKEQAQKNLSFARKGNEILSSVFVGLDPGKIAESGRPLQDVLRENLNRAAKELEGSAIGAPLEVASMQNTLGLSLLGLGEAKLAIVVFSKELTARRDHQGADHPDTLICMANLAEAYLADGNLEKALPLYEESLKSMTATVGSDHPDTITSMGNLAIGYEAAGKLEKSLPLLEATLKATTVKLGADHPSTLNAMHILALGYQSAGKMEKALPLLEDTLRLRTAKLGSDHPSTLNTMNNLATGYEIVGKMDLALPLFEKTFKARTATLGADHPDTLVTMGNLAIGYLYSGKMEQAIPLLEETLRIKSTKLGKDHPSTLSAMGNLALGYKTTGKLDMALPLLEETLRMKAAKLGADHPSTLIAMGNLATGYEAVGKLDKSLPLLEETVRMKIAKLGKDHPDTLASLGNLAAAYQVTNLDKAISLYLETINRQKTVLGPDHPNTLVTMNNLATAYQAAGKLDLALPLYESTLLLLRNKLGSEHPNTITSMKNLALAYLATGKGEQALPLCKEALKAFRKVFPKDRLQLSQNLATFGMSILQAGMFTDAEPLLRECLTIREKEQPNVWTTYNTQSMLGGALLGQKKYDDAEPLLRTGYEGMKQREASIPMGGQIRISEALDRLIDYYIVKNKQDDVKKYRELRAKYSVQVVPTPQMKK